MAARKLWIVAPVVVMALLIYATKTYENRQAYKTGIYIGKAAFSAGDYQNRTCLSVRGDSFRGACKVNDLNKDSVMEEALTSANIIPALSDSTELRTGFRDGWREARTAAFANR